MNVQLDRENSRKLAIWLFACCFMIFLILVVGGVTRLTNSGLSIVEWKPVTGIVPPLNDQKWDEEFNKYRRTPEYQKINSGMTLEEFKKIYWMEFIHRFLGRIAGAVFLLPFLYFLAKKRIHKKLIPKFIGIFLLGGLQGVIGWFMVRSGLSERADVSQYRLVLHLMTALVLYSFIFWTALDLIRQKKEVPAIDNQKHKILKNLSILLTILIFLQITLGGFVAGINAGLIYNTFPLMDGEFIPNGLLIIKPWYFNFFENHALVQFNHRIVAYLLVVITIIFFIYSQKTKDNRVKKYAIMFILAIFVQAFLGIMTLILNVPTIFASIHQAFAVVLLSLSLFINSQYVIKVSG